MKSSARSHETCLRSVANKCETDSQSVNPQTDQASQVLGVSDQRNSPAQLKVRAAQPADVETLQFFFDTALRRDYFIRRGQLADLVSDRYHNVYVAELDNVLVGVAVATRGQRLVNALVHPAYRGLGIGRALVDSSRVTEVRAKLDMSTGDPRPFYQRLGFKSTGARNKKGNVELMKKTHVGKRTGDKAARQVEPLMQQSKKATRQREKS